MVAIAGRHPRLNLMNIEAVAVGRLLGATMWLSEETTRGILPAVLEAENVAWETITVR